MKKLLTLAALVAALLTLSTGTAFAQEATPITGTVESVVPQTDEATGETIYVVTLTDEFGTTHVVNLSQETAEGLGLISVDETTGEVTINEVVDPITVNPEDILPVEEPGEEEQVAEHPVGSKLGEFFGELLGVDYDVIMEQKEQGFGFGVIAQALWLTNQIGGDSETFTALLEAKKTGDYSAIILADGSTPDNWGDVVKSLKKGENLGSVMSGKADDGSDDAAAETESANGRGNGKSGAKDNAGGNNGDNGNGNGNGKGNNGGGNGKGNGKGKP